LKKASKARLFVAMSGRTRWWAGSFEFRDFGIAEDPAPRQEPDALRRFRRESRPATRHDVDNELGVLPVFELGST
jgi:hypothetical protein